jgi:CheY-like chemotaxis protein
MQEMKGIEVLQRLRQMDKGQDTVIVVCTSHEHPSFVGHAHMAGASGFIVKPITPDKLLATLVELGTVDIVSQDTAEALQETKHF